MINFSDRVRQTMLAGVLLALGVGSRVVVVLLDQVDHLVFVVDRDQPIVAVRGLGSVKLERNGSVGFHGWQFNANTRG